MHVGVWSWTPLPPFWAYFLLKTAAMVHPGNHNSGQIQLPKTPSSLKAAFVSTHGIGSLV